MPLEMDKLLEATTSNGGSDLHLRVGAPPKLRVRGHLRSLGKDALKPEDTEHLVKSIASEKQLKELAEVGGTDFAIAFRDIARFRVAAFKHQAMIGLVLRQIPNKMLSMEQLGLPEVVRSLCGKPRGMQLVTGPTGSGKTTTLTAMINYINENRADHIITIEDPIEFIHPHKKCLVTQREIHADVPSFSEAIRRALRQDPEVILVGEMRDLETIEAAISAAETGHMVFGTLHTSSAGGTVNRLIDAFPTTAQEQIRAQLSSGLIGVVAQTLLPTIDGKGRVAAYEIMVCNSAIRSLIRENQTFKIDGIIQINAKDGMILLDDSLFKLYVDKRVKREDAIAKANNQDTLSQKIDNYDANQAKAGAGKK